MKGIILQKMHRLVGDHNLQDLRFTLGEIEPSTAPGEMEKKKRVPREGILNEEEKDRVERAVGAVSDLEIRGILRRIYSKALAADKIRIKG